MAAAERDTQKYTDRGRQRREREGEREGRTRRRGIQGGERLSHVNGVRRRDCLRTQPEKEGGC